MTPSRDAVRAWFPSLQTDFAYLENAGGSQVPGVVAEAMREYMLSSYVQLGAGYPQSVRATAVVEEAHAFMAEFVNAGPEGQVVLGPSTTALINLIASAYTRVWREGDEVIVATNNHESNVGPWTRTPATVRFWPVEPDTLRLDPERLRGLLTERTRLVALPHVSNLLGVAEDVETIVQVAHAAGAKVCVDGVAFAPHHAIDVRALGADWYVFSNYKVYGPHMATLYGTHVAFAELEGPNHFFLPRNGAYAWELGGVNHEGCAGLLALRPYLQFLAGTQTDGRATLEAAFQSMGALEEPLTGPLLDFLRSKPAVCLYATPGERHVHTVSFTHRRLTPPEITAQTDAARLGIRYGHMYAYRLCEQLRIPLPEGVVRISPLHYNTEGEIERLIQVLDPIL